MLADSLAVKHGLCRRPGSGRPCALARLPITSGRIPKGTRASGPGGQALLR